MSVDSGPQARPKPGGPCDRCGHHITNHEPNWGSCQFDFIPETDEYAGAMCGCPHFREMVNRGDGRLSDQTIARLAKRPHLFASWVIRAAAMELIDRRARVTETEAL